MTGLFAVTHAEALARGLSGVEKMDAFTHARLRSWLGAEEERRDQGEPPLFLFAYLQPGTGPEEAGTPARVCSGTPEERADPSQATLFFPDAFPLPTLVIAASGGDVYRLLAAPTVARVRVPGESIEISGALGRGHD